VITFDFDEVDAEQAATLSLTRYVRLP